MTPQLRNTIYFERVRRLRSFGRSYKDIAKETGVPKSTVRDWCQKEPKVCPNANQKEAPDHPPGNVAGGSQPSQEAGEM